MTNTFRTFSWVMEYQPLDLTIGYLERIFLLEIYDSDMLSEKVQIHMRLVNEIAK